MSIKSYILAQQLMLLNLYVDNNFTNKLEMHKLYGDYVESLMETIAFVQGFILDW